MCAEPVKGPCMVAPGEPPCVVVPGERQTRRFVTFIAASLALGLTLGVTLGMISLARLTGTWGELSRPSVWAHGYVQIFGFLALFVMGFAYHALPRFVGAALQHARLVPFALWLQVGGVLTIATGFLLTLPPGWARGLWIAGSGMLLWAAALFATGLIATVRARSGERQAFEDWMVAGALWLVFASGVALVAALRDDTTWHHVLWPAAFYGFAGSWIFGAGRRLFPGSLRLKTRWPRLERPALVLYQLGVAAWCTGAWPVGGPARIVRGLGAALLLVTVPAFSVMLGVFGARARQDDALGADYRDYERYIHAAWGWLFVGLFSGPGWALGAAARGMPDSITMLDFSRHTLALGFATQMIMGIGGRFVPVFNGTWLWSPRAHRVAFWLLNGAVGIRCLEALLALGYWSDAWPLLALSGPPAVAALVLFAVNMLMALRPRARPVYTRSSPAHRPLSALLEVPGALDVLAQAGFTVLRRPLVRATFARMLTLRRACRLAGIPLDPLLGQLSALKGGGTPASEGREHSVSELPPGWEPVALVQRVHRTGTHDETRRPQPDASRGKASRIGE